MSQDEKDEKRRALMLRRFKQRNRELLTNVEGLRRLRAISDEEWQEAADADANNEGA
jgi:hypothetical protein